MVSDSKRRESLLLTVKPNPSLAECTIRSGAGAFGLELHSRRRLAEPGEKMTLRWDMHLVKRTRDLVRVTADHCLLSGHQRADMIRAVTPLLENTVAPPDLDEYLLSFPWGLASLSSPDLVVRQPHSLEVKLRLMRLAKIVEASIPPVRFSLQVEGRRGAPVPLDRLVACAAETQPIQVNTAGLAGGRHRLWLLGEGKDCANSLAVDFAVIDEQDVGRRIERAKRLVRS